MSQNRYSLFGYVHDQVQFEQDPPISISVPYQNRWVTVFTGYRGSATNYIKLMLSAYTDRIRMFSIINNVSGKIIFQGSYEAYTNLRNKWENL